MATIKEEQIREDMKRLHAMGYAQELYRAMGGFSNFAISFTIISILSGCLTSFALGIGFAGPAAMSIGWPIVSIFTLCVALSMAELASAFPTAGGLYFWASKLGGAGWGWYTGWINLIGQVAVTTAIDYGLATFVNILMNQWWGTSTSPQAVMVTFTCCLALHAVMNILGVRLVALLNDVSVWWHIVVVLMFVFFLAIKAPVHNVGAAFHHTFTSSGFPYWYGFLLGFLLAQYTITGFDASAHMSEETIGADKRAPWGIVMSVVVSAIFGYLLLMALVIAIPSIPGKDELARLTGLSGGNPVGLILNSALGVNLGTLLLALAVVAQFYCGMSSVTSNSRMIYAFSRDGALPFSNLWHSLNKRTRTPVNAVLIGSFLAWLLALPSLKSATAYAAATSIAVIGLFLSYIIPIYLRRRQGTSFRAGVWHLGRYSRLISAISIAWVAFITVLFMLPTAYPINNAVTFNYTPIVVLGTLAVLTVWYLVSVRFWFKGPQAQGNATQLARIEHDLGEEVGVELAPA